MSRPGVEFLLFHFIGGFYNVIIATTTPVSKEMMSLLFLEFKHCFRQLHH